MITGDHRKDCCKPENGNLGPVEQYGSELTFQRCRVCQCRHFVGTGEPYALFAKGAPCGAQRE